MEDLMIAKKALDTGYTCVIAHNGLVLTNKDNIKIAINNFLSSNIDFSNYSLAITFVNSDICSLLMKLNIKKIFSYKLSMKAKSIFDSNKIIYRYSELIESDEFFN